MVFFFKRYQLVWVKTMISVIFVWRVHAGNVTVTELE